MCTCVLEVETTTLQTGYLPQNVCGGQWSVFSQYDTKHVSTTSPSFQTLVFIVGAYALTSNVFGFGGLDSRSGSSRRCLFLLQCLRRGCCCRSFFFFLARLLLDQLRLGRLCLRLRLLRFVFVNNCIIWELCVVIRKSQYVKKKKKDSTKTPQFW